MTDHHSIVAVVRDVQYLGTTLTLCIYKQEHTSFLSIHGLLASINDAKAAELAPCHKEMHAVCRSIEMAELLKRFNKKVISIEQFFDSDNKMVLQNAVYPFVWKQTAKLIQLIQNHSIAVYDARSTWPNLYEDHRIVPDRTNADMHLVFKRTDEGTRYMLQVKHNDHELDLQEAGTAIITEEPFHLLHNKKLLHFDNHISGKLVKPFLEKSVIYIPKRIEHKYFNGFVKKNVNKLNITAEGFEIIDLAHDPAAVLSIEMDWQGHYGFLLSFDYGGRRVLANSKQFSFTSLESADDSYVFKRFRRDMDFEMHMIGLLLETGLKQHGAFFRSPRGDIEKAEFMSFINEHPDYFESNGFDIEQPGDDKYIIARPEMVLRSYEHTDWFDLHIIIKVNKFEFPFIALKDHILTGDNVYMLPTGERFIIPNEWFERYKGLILHGIAGRETLRIDRRHFRLLDEFGLPEAAKLDEELLGEQRIEKPPMLDVQLRPYQLIGYAWMAKLCRQLMGGMLADDMGLGKTLQVIALLSSYFSEKEKSTDGVKTPKNAAKPAGQQLSLFGDETADMVEEPDDVIRDKHSAVLSVKMPALLVVPTSILHNWLNEFSRHTPWLKVHEYTGPGRSLNQPLLDDNHVILTTYGTMRADVEVLKTVRFSYAILDESHLIKNPYSKTARAAFSLQADHRFTMTGTPVENRLSDIWSQMHFVNPGLLGGLTAFQRYYASPLEKDAEASEGKQLLEMLRPFIMRRTKNQVARELPPITETAILCSMSESQSGLYEREKSRLRNLLLESMPGRERTQPKQLLLLRALMKLRQIANHPRMADQGHDADSGKFEVVTSKLETLVEENHKVLVFSSFVKHLEIMEAWCKQHGIAYAKLVGSTTKREEVISKFKEKDIPLFLISLKAGGVGLNLPEAGYVFLLDPWWNPAAEMQAINRTHRIGQDKNVIVYRFISKDTVEEKILKLQEKKRTLAETVIKAGEYAKNLSQEELESLFE